MLAIGAVTSLPVAAQDDTPPILVAHPLVGAWVVGRGNEDLAARPQLMVFSADGAATSWTAPQIANHSERQLLWVGR